MNAKIQTEIGIVLSYLTLLAGVIFFDWKPFNLLLSLILEYVSVLLIYVYVSSFETTPLLGKIINGGSNLIQGIFLGIFQGSFIMLLAYMITGRDSFNQSLAELPWLIPSIAIPMVIFQFISIRGKSKDKILSGEKMGELANIAATFIGVIGVGFLANEWSHENAYITSIAVISTRISFLIWKNHFRKPDKKNPVKIVDQKAILQKINWHRRNITSRR